MMSKLAAPAVICLIIYSLALFPIFEKIKLITHTVNTPDQFMMLMSFLPLFFLSSCAYNPTNSSRAHRILWAPRFAFPVWTRSLLNPWSLGDFIFVGFILLANVFWTVYPVILRVRRSQDAFDVYKITKLVFRWAGYAGMWDAGFAILFAVRENTLAKTIMGKEAGQYHRAIKYHVMFGYYSFTLLSAHSLFYLVDYFVQGTLAKNMLPWISRRGYINTFGLISWICLVFMIVTSIYKVRRSNYRLFYWTHQLYTIFVLFAFAHSYYTWFPIIGALAYLIHDRLVPRLTSLRDTRARITLLSDHLIRMDIINPQSLEYHPGDWINVRIPQISALDWHPFSITSSHTLSPDTMTLIIKVQQGWTRKLRDFVAHGSVVTDINVDGSFGSRHDQVHGDGSFEQDSPNLVFVGGGTGMSALIPHIQKCHEMGRHGDVHWVCKSLGDMIAYADFVEGWGVGGSGIIMHLHVTGSAAVCNEEAQRRLPHSRSSSLPETLHKQSSTATDCQLALRSTTNTRNLWRDLAFTRAMLCVIVFGFYTLGYSAGRVSHFSYDSRVCRIDRNKDLEGIEHFICWYWYNWAPAVVSAVCAVISGLSWTLLVGYMNHNPIDSKADPPTAVLADEAGFREAYMVTGSRPVWSEIVGLGTRAVMAAGPEGMVRDIEEFSLERGVAFYRESWIL